MLAMLSGVAVILFSSAGVARMIGWSGDFFGNPGSAPIAKAAVVSKPGRSNTRRMCAHCGVITSMREIAVGSQESGQKAFTVDTASVGREPIVPTRKFEIVVLMADGSSRVFEEQHPAKWREGERLIFIDASSLSN